MRRNVIAYQALDSIKNRLASSERNTEFAKCKFGEIEENNFSLHPESYVKKDIDDVAIRVAKDWRKLGLIAEVIQGTRGLSRLSSGNMEIIRGENINQLRNATESLRKINTSELSNHQLKTTMPNDLLIKRLGDRAATYMVKSGDPERVVDETVFILRFDSVEPLQIQFIAEFLNSERGSSHISSFCRSTTVQTLTKSILSEIDVPLADEPLQYLVHELGLANEVLSREVKKANHLHEQIYNGLGFKQALDNFDETRYALKALESALSNKDKVSFKVSNNYPFTIAYAYRNLYVEREWSAVYERQMKFGELVLSFLVGVGLALLTDHEKENPSILNVISRKFFDSLQGGISPGHWRALLHDICSELRKISSCPLASEFAAMWFKGRGSKLSDFALASEKEFVRKLNSKKHHRGPEGAEASKIAANEQRKIIDELLLEIEFISQWQFFINDNIRVHKRTNRFICSVSHLKGDHPCFEQAEIDAFQALSDNEIYVIYQSKIVCLSPFLVSKFNPDTKRNEIYSLDSLGSSNMYKFKSFDSGHTMVADQELKLSLDEWFECHKADST